MKHILFQLNDTLYYHEVDDTGAVTADATVLWDERKQGPIPADVVAPYLEQKQSDQSKKDADKSKKEQALAKLQNSKNADLGETLQAVIAYLGIEVK